MIIMVIIVIDENNDNNNKITSDRNDEDDNDKNFKAVSKQDNCVPTFLFSNQKYHDDIDINTDKTKVRRSNYDDDLPRL